MDCTSIKVAKGFFLGSLIACILGALAVPIAVVVAAQLQNTTSIIVCTSITGLALLCSLTLMLSAIWLGVEQLSCASPPEDYRYNDTGGRSRSLRRNGAEFNALSTEILAKQLNAKHGKNRQSNGGFFGLAWS